MRKRNYIMVLLLMPLLIISLAACSGRSSLKPTVVSRGDAQKTELVRTAILRGFEEVEIEGDRTLGAAIGAGIGAVIGNQAVRKSHGTGTEVAASAAGAVLGGMAGEKVGNALSKKAGLRLLVEFETGEVLSIIQEADDSVVFKVDDPVLVYGSTRLRVMPVKR
jgi:outer membrane lipoprotein SlyB